MEYAVGSKGIILSNFSGHGFPIGTKVGIIQVGKLNYLVQSFGAPSKQKTIFGDSLVFQRWVKVQDFMVQSVNNLNNQVKTTQVMNKQILKDTVEKVANQLMTRDGNITTLPLLRELQNQFPFIAWDQYSNRQNVIGVSDIFHELVREGKFKSVADNGRYQTYKTTQNLQNQLSSALKTASKNSTRMNNVGFTSSAQTAKQSILAQVQAATKHKGASPVKTAKAKATKAKGITKDQARNLMANNKGHFFTATFVKKDGTIRTINCQYLKDQGTTKSNLVKVREAAKAKYTPEDSIRNLNLDTLQSLKIKGQTLPVA